jgi:Ca2+-binding RTX toxin-like protein
VWEGRDQSGEGRRRLTSKILRAVLGAGLLATFALVSGTAGAAVESCSYDAGTKRVTAEIASGSEATLKVKSSGALWFGLVPVDCGGATTTNTDFITVLGTTGTVEKFTVDMTEGFIGPGFSAESNLPEIEFAVNTGDTADRFAVIGRPAGDRMAAGASGFSFNSDGDLDVTFTPLPSHMDITGGAGVNFLTARGGWGAGLSYAGNTTITGGSSDDELNGGNGADAITGGGGADVINGSGGPDTMTGGGGADRISGGEGNDTLTGGPGADDLIAGAADDTLFANDQETDVQIHGGAGIDTATVDANIDPQPIAVETTIVDSGPPPPPPPPNGSCSYNAATKSVTATVATGGTATLSVVGGAIYFGNTPAACGAATTANTNTISISGSNGSVEHLTVDQSGGALAPGATAEATGISEIELAINLGSASDVVVVRGTTSADALAIGLKGVSFNNDTDVDVTITPLPSSVELAGGDGADTLTARGGFGSGQLFPGPVTLRGDDGDDNMTGSDFADLILGGAGVETVSGYLGADDIQGEGGNDHLNGNDGNDTLVGGAGADALVGSTGDDTLQAADGEADTTLSGGAGIDTCFFDAGLDPGRSGVEIQNPQ